MRLNGWSPSHSKQTDEDKSEPRRNRNAASCETNKPWGPRMYQYDQYDQTIVDERVAQYADQVRRRLSGELSEEEFRPLRLQNGLYMQRHAYMHRIAIPYGNLRSDQLRMLATIAREHDRGYGHFSTRSNIQYNWIKLEETPEILRKLASVQMHGIQTSGNCIRNITADQFAGASAPSPRAWPRRMPTSC